jgi:hypothetical protein
MDDAQVWALLERGGTLGAAHYEVDGVHRLRRFERFDPLADPDAAQQLGTALAARLGDGAYNLVTVWDTVENAVLGFVVGLALRCPVVRVFDHEGLIRESGPIPHGARGVFVAPAIVDQQEPRLVRALLEAREASLAAVAVLVDAGEAAEPPIALVRVESYPPERCPACQRGEQPTNARVPLAPGGLHG